MLGEQVSDAYLAELREDGVSYIFAGPKGDDLALAMEQLGAVFGVNTLLLEGGGAINGSFLKQRLIDEFSTLLAGDRVLDVSLGVVAGSAKRYP